METPEGSTMILYGGAIGHLLLDLVLHLIAQPNEFLSGVASRDGLERLLRNGVDDAAAVVRADPLVQVADARLVHVVVDGDCGRDDLKVLGRRGGLRLLLLGADLHQDDGVDLRRDKVNALAEHPSDRPELQEHAAVSGRDQGDAGPDDASDDQEQGDDAGEGSVGGFPLTSRIALGKANDRMSRTVPITTAPMAILLLHPTREVPFGCHPPLKAAPRGRTSRHETRDGRLVFLIVFLAGGHRPNKTVVFGRMSCPTKQCERRIKTESRQMGRLIL